MVKFSALAAFAAVQLLSLVGAAPAPQAAATTAASSSSYWLSTITRQGTVAFGNDSSYQIYRNVKDFGAKGDGSTDDTAAINQAISSGSRCGDGCDSTTVTPAIVYFPPGTYMVSKPIVQYYYTHFIGDALNLPVLKATSSFEGMAVIDSDPYLDSGANWFTNQNNFFRQIRNFVIDLTALDQSKGAGIHWQVAQATSLQNIRFEMVQSKTDANKQQGIFMDNGSGGFFTDLIFNGGNYGLFLGNQQFTTRNLTFNNCNTAIYMNWNWAWTFKSLSINNCNVGVNMSSGASSQTVGSILILDSKLTNTPTGIITARSATSSASNGTLILKNVDFTGSTAAVVDLSGSAILKGGSVVAKWGQGSTYSGTVSSKIKRDLLERQAAQADTCGTVISYITVTATPAAEAAPAPSAPQAQSSAVSAVTTVTAVTVATSSTVVASSATTVAASGASSAAGTTPSVVSIPGTVSPAVGTAPAVSPSPIASTAGSAGSSAASSAAVSQASSVAGVSTLATSASGSASSASKSSSSTVSSSSSLSTSSSSNGTCSVQSTSVKQAVIQGDINAPTLPSVLLSGDNVFERSKPQYETLAASSFISVKANGAKGDGVTDDTAAIQKILDSATSDQVVYFDHGAYIITSTVKVPKNIRITGEIWPLIMASGDFFSDKSNPKPVFQIGQPGDMGSVEMSDLIFETAGPAPGAILMEWNIHESTQGSCGMWDVHFRVGGSAGTQLQSDKCAKNENVTTTATAECEGAFLMLHLTKTASAYLENTWFWVADHELDLADHRQINIFNGRGVLIESEGPVWLYGTASEHSQLYNYQLSGAKNVFMALIQTETAYMQSNPNALEGGFAPNSTYNDPEFADCTDDSCKKTWGLRILDSSDVYMYGGGLYSFYDNYHQECLADGTCQTNMVDIQCSSSLYLYGLSTKASVNMVTLNGQAAILGSDNPSTYCSTVALFEQ